MYELIKKDGRAKRGRLTAYGTWGHRDPRVYECRYGSCN